MAHNIQAIVGRSGAIAPIVKDYRISAITLPQSFSLLLLTDDFYDALAPVHGVVDERDDFFLFTGKVNQLINEYSRGVRLAYIETDYFGGIGEQGACVVEDCRIIYRAKTDIAPVNVSGEGPINGALALLNVSTLPGVDGFDTLQLGRYRNNDWASRNK